MKFANIPQKFTDRESMERRTFLKNAALSSLTLPLGLSADNLITLREVIDTPQKISKVAHNTNNLELFLTIDDGWYEQQQIVTLADRYKAPLSMFIIGKVIAQCPKVWQNAIEKGHELGSHTYNHPAASKMTPVHYREDLREYKKVVEKHLGTETFKNISLFRFPYGDMGNKHNKEEIKKIVTDEYGWKIAKWNMDLSYRPERPKVKPFASPEDQFRFFTSNVTDKQVILLHFKRPDSLALEHILRYGSEQKIKFSRMSEKMA